jgi:serine/threonine protein kinase/Tol biopolymer transport system component
MVLSAGTKLGPYEIQSPLGTGGMGEVYRAKDSKLGRDIALKVIPHEFAQDAQRMARFQREAQVLASLNHPNIASIYGLEESGRGPALVMELIEGPSLAERIKGGPIPVEEALGIAKQIAEALEYAHERGIIHRDLKPANIKLTPDGKVKLLDFGLAKALQGDTVAKDASNSPTLTHAASEAGIILGTAAYMSPEQAKGRAVDRRADIWSFGVVLFEMLTGRQLFAGDTATEILAAVVRDEPDWAMLPKEVPRRIRELLRRCLIKDEKRRLAAIGDARFDLDNAPEEALEATSPPRKRFWFALPWVITVCVFVILALLLLHRAGSDMPSRQVMHVDIEYPPNVEPIQLQGGFAVSPDGRSVAMIGVRDGMRRLYIRRLDRPEAAEIDDTVGVNSVFFSPDSANVAFVPGSASLTRLSLADQQRVIVAPGADFNGDSGAWGSEWIVYTRGSALWIVPPQGGKAKQLTALDTTRHEVLHGDPTVLPGGRTVLFSSLTTDSGAERIEAVSIDSRKRWVVIEHGIKPVWSPTGHLLFARDDAVWAVPFDPNSVTVRGRAVLVIPSGVVSTMLSGSPSFQLSSTGTLIFVPANFNYKRVISVGRDGSEKALNLPPNRYADPRISPDGRRLVIQSGGSVIEMLDLLRGTRARLTPAALGTSFPTWTSDSEGVVFRRFNVPFWATADGTGKMGAVPGGLANDFPSSPGPDSDSIVAVRIQPETTGDIFLMSISGKFQPKPLLVSPAYEGGPQLSPDRHWILYQSNESGQPEIYVRRFPTMDRQWQVSEGGGVQGRWSSTSREIYYRNGKHMMAAALDVSKVEPAFGKPTALFADEYDFGMGVSIPNYDVTREGRFIMLRRGTEGNGLHVVINWTEELKQILAAGGAR